MQGHAAIAERFGFGQEKRQRMIRVAAENGGCRDHLESLLLEQGDGAAQMPGVADQGNAGNPGGLESWGRQAGVFLRIA